MYEIEAKVPLERADFERLKRELPKIAEKKGKSEKKDFYYGNLNHLYLRIRQMDQGAILSLKSKKTEKGIEMNQEMELPVKSIKKLQSLLKKMGFECAAKKEKTTELYQSDSLKIELNKVKRLGYYLEIETIVKSEADIPKAKKRLIETFTRLGYSQKDFEKKYYLQLLDEKRKNI
ncbi:MAG: class IV adenylate cyclase [Candidatus Magasanikbacteria bacterium]|nr:class IV adenylate cyclase [Candidatus Magasanikbacteria bacterium]